MTELSDFAKANITQLSFFFVTFASFIYMGWLRDWEEDNERSKYFAGALDAVQFAASSAKAAEKKRAILKANAEAKAKRHLEKQQTQGIGTSPKVDVDRCTGKEDEDSKAATEITKRNSVKRASIAQRNSILDEIDDDLPKPTPAFKRASIKKRISLQGSLMESSSIEPSGDVEAGNPVHESNVAPTQMAAAETETPHDLTDVASEQYSMPSHFYFDVNLMSDEVKTWPGSHPSSPSGAEDAFLLQAIRDSAPRWYRVALSDLQANPAILTQFGYTTLHEAFACRSDDAICSDLCDGKISALSRTSNGTTLLMKAIIADNFRTAATLIENGCDVDLQDLEGNTALMHGCLRGNPRCARFLISYGADPHILNADGLRAVDLALLCGNARAATDIQGNSAVVVPGYVPSPTQTTSGALTLAYTVIRQVLDVMTDILVTIELWETEKNLARTVLAFLTLPSVYMALMPYQSIFERFITIMQLRVPYEALISMNQEKTSVRFGAMEMIQTVLQNCPQLVLQSFIISKNLSLGMPLSSMKNVVFSVVMSTNSSGETFKLMYMQRYNLPDNPDDDVSHYDSYGICCSLYSVCGVLIRAVFWAVLLSTQTRAEVFGVGFYILLTRLRLISMDVGTSEDLTKLDLTAIDIGALLLSDLPFSANCQQFQFAEMLSFMENTAVIWNCAVKFEWFNSLIWFAVGSFVKESAFFYLMHFRIHGSSYECIDTNFMKSYFLLHGLKEYIVSCKNSLWKSIKSNGVYYKRIYRYQRRLYDGWCVERGWNTMDMGDEEKKRRLEFLATHRRRKQKLQRAKSAKDEGIESIEGFEHSTDSTFSKMNIYTTFKWSRFKWRDLPPLVFLVLNLFLVISFAVTGSCVKCDTTDDSYNDDNYNRLNDDNYNRQSNVYRNDDAINLPCCTGWGTFATKAALPLVIIFYAASFFEALSSPIGKSMRRAFQTERCYDYFIQSVGAQKPVLQWHSISYHYEEHRDKDGNVTRTKVVTRDVTGNYTYDDCTDNSDKFMYNGEPFVHISTTSEYKFHDDYTSTDYSLERAQFYEKNNVDTYQDKIDNTFYGEKKETEILPPMLMFAEGGVYLLRFTYFVYATVLSLSFFYRWFVNSISVDMNLSMKKVIITRPKCTYDPDTFVHKMKFFMDATGKELSSTNKESIVKMMDGGMTNEEKDGAEKNTEEKKMGPDVTCERGSTYDEIPPPPSSEASVSSEPPPPPPP